jgi:hypothetical protein
MSVRKRLERLEADLEGVRPPPEWPVEDQAEALLHTLYIHKCGRSVYQVTDRELDLLDALVAQEFVPETDRELCTRMDPAKQPKRERFLRENWQETKRGRELAQKRIAWKTEHGWDKPTPRHLLPGGEA